LASNDRFYVEKNVVEQKVFFSPAGGLRKRMGTPMMLYFPNLCVENAWNKGGKYTWSDTAAESGAFQTID
jgi:hypothetical protein